MSEREYEFLVELTQATRLVERLLTQRLALVDFEREYGNYYYAAALDGHEGSIPSDLFPHIRAAIRLHAGIQDILNRTYHNESIDTDAEDLRRAGRISPPEAEVELRRLAREHDLTGILRDLESMTP